jgi:DNA-binding MarR family transcriptional regulator
MTGDQIDRVRCFHRLVTQRAGALDDHFLGRDRPLGESRVLFEIGADGATLRELRARLGLDSGYLSRLVQSLCDRGLVTLRAHDADERVKRAQLTRTGRAELREVNRRSDHVARDILTPLTATQRERLTKAMDEVRRLLEVAGARFEVVDPRAGDAQWCLAQYYAELANRFDGGFDPGKSMPVDDAELRPPSGAFVIGRIDGRAIACGLLKRLTPRIGYLKRMWVSPSMRGCGFGRRTLEELESHARRLGMTTLRLETNRALTEAIQLYRASGYREVAAFNDERYAHHWFEKRLGRR